MTEEIERLVMELSQYSPLANAVLRRARFDGWDIRRTIGVMAYVLLVDEQEHFNRLVEVQAQSARPLLIKQHCSTCTCTDKSTGYEDL